MSEMRGSDKDIQKREEKDEKSFDEKWRRDPISAVVWAGILIWAGMIWLLDNFDLLDRFAPLDAWNIIMIGAGLIILLEVLLRFSIPEYRQPVTGTIILAIILLGIGLGGLGIWEIIWPIVIIFIGLSILARGLFRQRD